MLLRSEEECITNRSNRNPDQQQQHQPMDDDPTIMVNRVPPTWEELGNRQPWAVRVSIARAPVQGTDPTRLAPPMLIIVRSDDLELRNSTYELALPC